MIWYGKYFNPQNIFCKSSLIDNVSFHYLIVNSDNISNCGGDEYRRKWGKMVVVQFGIKLGKSLRDFYFFFKKKLKLCTSS